MSTRDRGDHGIEQGDGPPRRDHEVDSAKRFEVPPDRRSQVERGLFLLLESSFRISRASASIDLP
jgi:hypothetical protein